MKKILIILGTRPEAIKLAPIIRELQEHNDFFALSVCDTGQHLEIKQPILDFFQIKPDYQLEALAANTNLSNLTSYLLSRIQAVIEQCQPDLILVQGDTTSAMAGALAGFYNRVQIAHIEAGLRTYNKNMPFPEEINRRIITEVADWHFAPTELARTNLINEGIPENRIFLVGNTVVDALHFALEKIRQEEPAAVAVLKKNMFPFRQRYAKMLLLTLHRRENLTNHLEEIGAAVQAILTKEDCFALFPVHPNPAVRHWSAALARQLPNLLLTEPLSYETFVWAMQSCDLILTDSGGIQEEAPSLGKPVIVLRAQTERPEALQSGTVCQVSIDRETIEHTVSRLLNQEAEIFPTDNPFGLGNSARQIIKIIHSVFKTPYH